jgi:hypothetical protein
MNPDVPQSLKIAAIAQIASGAISVMMTWWLSSCFISTVCGIMTLGFGGQLCGLLSWLLIPLGLIEIGVGIFGLVNPKEAAKFQKIVSFLEMAAILLGGVVNAVCGGIAFMMLGKDESVAYLEG